MGSKSVTIGYRYFMGMHFGIGHGPMDEFVAAKVGDRMAFEGSVTASGHVEINKPDLFGGEKKEGGIQGTLDVMMGEATQEPNPYLGAVQGGLNPAYRGLVSLVFHGNPVGTTPGFGSGGSSVILAAIQAAIAAAYSSGASGGGLIACMNPYPKPWAFRFRRALMGWNTPVWYSAKAVISLASGTIKAMNPAHIAYQCITDPEWGMGYPTSSIDTTSFTATADQLYTEGFGLNLKWNRQDSIENFLQLIADHVGGAITTDRRTGKWRFNLIRGDYDPETLPVFNQSNVVKLTELEPGSLENCVNELTVVFRDPITNKDGSVTVQSLAAIQAQGRVIAEKKEYRGLGTQELAARVAGRDLRLMSVGLKRISLEVDRSGYDLVPGDVFKLDWPPEGMTLFLRVAEIKYGTQKDGVIEIKAIEDLFGLPSASYVKPQPPGWVEPDLDPLQMTGVVEEASYYDLMRIVPSEVFSQYVVGEGSVVTFGHRPNAMHVSYDMYLLNGVTYENWGSGEFCPTGLLTSAMDLDDTTMILGSLVSPDQIALGDIVHLGNEKMRIQAWNVLTRTATVLRAVADTLPEAHAIGDRAWMYGQYYGLPQKEALAGQAVWTKLVPRTGGGVFPVDSATAYGVSMDYRKDRPYPPARVTLDGLLFPTNLSGAGKILDWRSRNKITQADTLVGWFENVNYGAESGTTYRIRQYDGLGNLKLTTVPGVGVTSMTFVPMTTVNRIVVDSLLNGLYSRQAVDFTVNWIGYGLAYGDNYGGT